MSSYLGLITYGAILLLRSVNVTVCLVVVHPELRKQDYYVGPVHSDKRKASVRPSVRTTTAAAQ